MLDLNISHRKLAWVLFMACCDFCVTMLKNVKKEKKKKIFLTNCVRHSNEPKNKKVLRGVT